jgi:3-phosphoshikimate 1-carboxyvinyltransferase
MIKTVKKINKGLKGEILIPPDKSISHRAVMFASLAHGECQINNFSNGADCLTTLKIFRELGVNIQIKNSSTLLIKSNGKLYSSEGALNAGNSGTTTRLLSGILAGQNFDSVIIGDESLSKRPMKRIIEPLSLMGANIESNNGYLPLKIYGTKLHGIEYNSKLASAQVKSCVLLAGLNADGKTTYTEPFFSRNHTELLLHYLGADIRTSKKSVTIYPSELTAKDITIVGDISSAAFFIVAGLIVPNSNFVIKNVGINPTRSGIIDIVKRMNGEIYIHNTRDISGEQCADIMVCYSNSLYGCIIKGEDIPRLIDELPVIAVLASQARGQTVIKDADDLRNKESDRIKCLVNELTKIGVNIAETADGFIIEGKTKINGDAELECYNDHRLAMTFYVAGLIAENEIGINGFEWTNISFPEFERLFNILR